MLPSDRKIILGLTRATVKMSGVCADLVTQLPNDPSSRDMSEQLKSVNDILSEVISTMTKEWGSDQ